MYIMIWFSIVKGKFSFCSQICDFGLARLEEPHESAIMTQEVNNYFTCTERG